MCWKQILKGARSYQQAGEREAKLCRRIQDCQASDADARHCVQLVDAFNHDSLHDINPAAPQEGTEVHKCLVFEVSPTLTRCPARLPSRLLASVPTLKCQANQVILLP